MNELLFTLHILVVFGFIGASLRSGNRYSLITLVALEALMANLFVVKQMELFGMTVTCSDVYSIGCILSLNLLQEYHGKEAAKDAIKISFLGLIFYVCMTQMHLLYIPAAGDMTQKSFETIFAATPRIIFASIAVFYTVMKLDVILFGWLKKRFSFPQMIGISLFCSQLIDTVLFSFVGLYGIVDSVFDIIVVSYLIKCIMIICVAPLLALSKRLTHEHA